MFNWRVTKYNPNYRDEFRRYKRSEWTSFCEIGKVFDGNKLTNDNYIAIENAYVDAIVAFMNGVENTSLTVKGLEKKNNNIMLNREHELYSDEMINFYAAVQENDVLSIRAIQHLARLVLREDLWCKLEKDDIMFVHFGYDYYMYIGSHKICVDAINKIKKRGLFVEDFISPYNDEDGN